MSGKKAIITNSEAETQLRGEAFGRSLTGGEVILLTGDLGAGKTVFARGVARGLQIAEPATSPTFTLLNVYGSGRLTLCHFDAYRLRSPDEVFTSGLTDYLGAANTVCVIEWPERAGDIFSYDSIAVRIKKLNDSSREIEGL